MVILIKIHKEVICKMGQKYYVDTKVFMKIPANVLDEIPFDISSVDAWGYYLANTLKTPNGKPLPLCDEAGQEYMYEVINSGSLKKYFWDMFPEHLHRVGSTCFFPGYTPAGVKEDRGKGNIRKYRQKK
jgi:hypothetical protein